MKSNEIESKSNEIISNQIKSNQNQIKSNQSIKQSIKQSIEQSINKWNPINQIKMKDKKEIILKHLDLSIEHYGKDIGIKSFRKHLGWYSKSIENSNEFRFKINKCSNEFELKNLINGFF